MSTLICTSLVNFDCPKKAIDKRRSKMNKRINFSTVQRLVKNVDIEFAVMVQHCDGGSWGDLMVGRLSSLAPV